MPQVGGGTSYTFAGTADHAVSCLSYGDSTVTAAQARTLTDAEIARAQQALAQARVLVNPSTGILGVATGKSNDHPGEAAVIVYVDEKATVNVPAAVDGVRTLVIPTNAHAVAFGSAPQSPLRPASPAPARVGPQPGASRQTAVRRQPAEAESGVLRRGRGPEPRQPQGSGAGGLRGPQKVPGQLPAIGGRPAHPLHRDGPAARDPVVCGSVAVEGPLHATSGGNPAVRIRSGRGNPSAELEAELSCARRGPRHPSILPAFCRGQDLRSRSGARVSHAATREAPAYPIEGRFSDLFASALQSCCAGLRTGNCGQSGTDRFWSRYIRKNGVWRWVCRQRPAKIERRLRIGSLGPRQPLKVEDNAPCCVDL